MSSLNFTAANANHNKPYSLPLGRLKRLTLTGKILFATKSTIVTEIQGEEFTFNTAQFANDKFKFIKVGESGEEPVVELYLSEILETKAVQSIGLKVDTHEVIFYGTENEVCMQLNRELQKAKELKAP